MTRLNSPMQRLACELADQLPQADADDRHTCTKCGAKFPKWEATWTVSKDFTQISGARCGACRERKS